MAISIIHATVKIHFSGGCAFRFGSGHLQPVFGTLIAPLTNYPNYQLTAPPPSLPINPHRQQQQQEQEQKIWKNWAGLQDRQQQTIKGQNSQRESPLLYYSVMTTPGLSPARPLFFWRFNFWISRFTSVITNLHPQKMVQRMATEPQKHNASERSASIKVLSDKLQHVLPLKHRCWSPKACCRKMPPLWEKNIRTENWWCPFGCALSRLQLLAASVKPGLKQNSSVSPVRQFTEGCLVHGLHPAWFLLALSKMFLTAPERNFLSVWNSHVTCTHQIRHIPALSVFTSISCLPITLRARLWNSLHVSSHQGHFRVASNVRLSESCCWNEQWSHVNLDISLCLLKQPFQPFAGGMIWKGQDILQWLSKHHHAQATCNSSETWFLQTLLQQHAVSNFQQLFTSVVLQWFCPPF